MFSVFTDYDLLGSDTVGTNNSCYQDFVIEFIFIIYMNDVFSQRFQRFIQNCFSYAIFFNSNTMRILQYCERSHIDRIMSHRLSHTIRLHFQRPLRFVT